MKKASTAELSAVREELLPLITRSNAFVGDVALRGYEKLQALPTLDSSVQERGMDTERPGYRSRFRAVGQDTSPVVVNQSGTRVLEVATETIGTEGRKWLFRPQRHFLRGVTVSYWTPGDRVASHISPVSFSIDTQGNAQHNGSEEYTYPKDDLLIGLNATRHYPTIDGMRSDYAQKYTNTFRVAEVIASGLLLAHGIESDLSRQEELAAAWQDAAPSYSGDIEFDLKTAFYLPDSPTDSL